MVIAFRNNENGFTAVKEYCYAVNIEKKIKQYQTFYNKMYGKGSFYFYKVDAFFKPYTNQLYNKSWTQKFSVDQVPDSAFETTTVGERRK